MRALSALAVPLGALLLLTACEPDKKMLPRVAATGKAFLDTRFDACDEQTGSNPSPRNVDGAGLAEALHGTWVARRSVRDGKSMYPELVPGREPEAHHIMVLDMKSGVGLQYEERGPAVESNGFAKMLPAPASPLAITYLYCGGKEFSAFRDQYIKVSDDPAAGLRALARHSGIALSESSVSAAWEKLRDAGYFARNPNGSLQTAAYYTISTATTERAGTGIRDVRWDMVGEYRGSPAKFAQGQPSTGLEGGIFQGVSTEQGDFWVGEGVAVSCYGVAVNPNEQDTLSSEPDTLSSGSDTFTKGMGASSSVAQTFQQSPLIYDKIVIGPLS